MPKATRLFADLRGILSFAGEKQLISFLLKLLDRDLSTGMGLQMRVELIVLLHAGFAGHSCRDTGTEFLKVHTYPVEGEAASAVGTLNSCQCWAVSPFLREVMNSRTSSIEENTLSLLRELQGWQQMMKAVLAPISSFFLLFGKKWSFVGRVLW
ncbi:MAG TPA: hypothetical protein VE422_16060 [Terriglobia bacterium]|nr:hypothetical protein [Terriglobia bacterium]